jgi:hypothetical protein
MDTKQILADLRVCNKAYKLITNPDVAIRLDRKEGSPDKRVRMLRTLERRMTDLEFAYEMVSAKVAEPERTVNRGNA